MRDTPFLSTWTSCRSLSSDLAFSKASIQEFEVVLTSYFTPATSDYLTVFWNCSITATSSPFKSDLGFISLLSADVLTECKTSASRLPRWRQSFDGWSEVYVAARVGERRQKTSGILYTVSMGRYDIMSPIDFHVLLSCIHAKYLMTDVEVWTDWDGTGGLWEYGGGLCVRVCICSKANKRKSEWKQSIGRCVCVCVCVCVQKRVQ